MDHVNVPHAVRPSADQVVAVTDAVCRAHLDMEYADLCRAVVGKLGRKRPSPLTRGDLRIWAAGVVYAVGQLNFVFDPSSRRCCRPRNLSVTASVTMRMWRSMSCAFWRPDPRHGVEPREPLRRLNIARRDGLPRRFRSSTLRACPAGRRRSCTVVREVIAGLDRGLLAGLVTRIGTGC